MILKNNLMEMIKVLREEIKKTPLKKSNKRQQKRENQQILKECQEKEKNKQVKETIHVMKIEIETIRKTQST